MDIYSINGHIISNATLEELTQWHKAIRIAIEVNQREYLTQYGEPVAANYAASISADYNGGNEEYTLLVSSLINIELRLRDRLAAKEPHCR